MCSFYHYVLVWWFSVDTVLLTVCVLIILALIFICNRNSRKRKIFNTEHLKRDDVTYKFNRTKFPVYLYTFSYPDPKCIRFDICTRKIRGCWCTRRCILHCSPCTRLYLKLHSTIRNISWCTAIFHYHFPQVVSSIQEAIFLSSSMVDYCQIWLPTYWMWCVRHCLSVYVHNSTVINVRGDDWTTEWVIIATNENDNFQYYSKFLLLSKNFKCRTIYSSSFNFRRLEVHGLVLGEFFSMCS